eukprot:2437120-Rhodomonas_salina.1
MRLGNEIILKIGRNLAPRLQLKSADCLPTQEDKPSPVGQVHRPMSMPSAVQVLPFKHEKAIRIVLLAEPGEFDWHNANRKDAMPGHFENTLLSRLGARQRERKSGCYPSRSPCLHVPTIRSPSSPTYSFSPWKSPCNHVPA